MTEPTSITILAIRRAEAVEMLAKLNKKAARYGTPPVAFTVSDPFKKKIWITNERSAMIDHVTITLDHVEAPKVGNFQFIAAIENTPSGKIVDTIPGETLPASFREPGTHCDHCKTDRYRKLLYVVRGEDGQHVQIGGSCLRDYMGTDTPASVLRRFMFLRSFSNMDDEFNGGFGGSFPDSAVELLAVTATAIRLWGWVPKSAPESAGEPTAYRIAHWFYCSAGDKKGQADRKALEESITDADYELAETVIAWIADNGQDTDYMANLRVILSSGVVEAKRRGYACSAVAAYQRHLGKLELRRREAAETANS